MYWIENAVIYFMFPVNFNINLMQYIDLFLLSLLWYNYLQFLCSLGGCHAGVQQVYCSFYFIAMYVFLHI
jgi:hypothetical protein